MFVPHRGALASKFVTPWAPVSMGTAGTGCRDAVTRRLRYGRRAIICSWSDPPRSRFTLPYMGMCITTRGSHVLARTNGTLAFLHSSRIHSQHHKVTQKEKFMNIHHHSRVLLCAMIFGTSCYTAGSAAALSS